MTDRMLNELLDAEVQAVMEFYQATPHYTPYEYMRIAGDGPRGTAVSLMEAIDPGDTDLIKLMRKKGADHALRPTIIDPLAIFVVQAGVGIRIDTDGPAPPQKIITIHGVTNDGRFGVAVLPAQWDEDGRLYAVPTEIFRWQDGSNPAHINVLAYLEFFMVNDNMRAKIAV